MFPADEWQAIALNYTSGTTGNPKGVVYHHRGAHLNAVGNVLVWSMPQFPVYLWTLPMFHCNGWCFPWSIVLQAGTQVCLRRVASETIFAALAEQGVTHLCGAPIVMGMLVNAPESGAPAVRAEGADDDRGLRAAGGGAGAHGGAGDRGHPCLRPDRGLRAGHRLRLAGGVGPSSTPTHRSRMLARQGVPYPVLEGLDVMDPATMMPVPRDGATIGEIMMRGHDVMKGYLKNPTATDEAFAGGWFHTGDLAVMHPDGYVEIKDRSKDIIISGGENISSIEVEGALYRHPAVLEAAVVARPDPQWGESPCAFVTLREGATATAEELIEHCRNELARFKAPRTVVFGPLPKTSTGKIQKFQLREQAKQALAARPAPVLACSSSIRLLASALVRLASNASCASSDKRLQIRGLRAGHRLVAGGPVLDRLLGVRARLGIALRIAGRGAHARLSAGFVR